MSNAPQFMTQRRLEGTTVPLRQRSGPAGGFTVAAILDDFSAACFGPEVDLAPLTMRDWRAELTMAQPDMLLVESAWRGHHQTWWNAVFRMGPEIRGVLEWCRERGIPTAFWNKEDPVHFRTFLTLAKEFDAVLTTDLDMVPHYRAALRHDNVHFFPFAAQPAVHNPLELFERVEGCAFAGAYYRKYPERTEDLDHLSQALADSGTFHIYDRNFGQAEGDYSFPSEYQDFIVGGLAPSEIDIAYKGYTANLNLNSVKHSQSMFARRVYELMASGTLVISNFSRGLRGIFGELAVVSDSPKEVSRRLAHLDQQPNGRERLRAMALRKVMREHTYAERAAFVAQCLGLLDARRRPQRVFLAAACAADVDVRRVVASALRQDHDDWILALVCAGVDPGQLLGDARIRVFATAREALAWAREEQAEHAALLGPDDWYGPHYVSDLLDALMWADVDCVGLEEHFDMVDGVARRRTARRAWRASDSLPAHRSLVTGEQWRAVRSWEQWAVLRSGLATSPVGYCAQGADASPESLAPVMDLDVEQGSSLHDLRLRARALPPPIVQSTESDLDMTEIAGLLEESEHWDVQVDSQGQVAFVSELPADQHRYRYTSPVPLEGLFDLQDPTVHFQMGPGLDVTLAVVFVDGSGTRLGHTMGYNGKNVALDIPEGTTHVKFGFRVKGAGRAVLERIAGAAIQAASMPVQVLADTLVVSNIYPSHENLYRNAFVHSRVLGYRARGARCEVMVVDPNALPRRFREFDGIDVTVADPGTLAATLDTGRVRNLLVHVLTRPLWNVLRDRGDVERITVWVHGFEIQPWWRRAFNLTTDEQVEEAKRVSQLREEFWREVFQELPANMHLVFVSRQFAETVFEDIGGLREDQYSIIHNPIDTELFAYRQKDVAHARRILTIRPYANATYANDLSVNAVLELANRPGFEDLHFTFCGDGPLFEQTLEPLREFANVEIRRGFLTHSQIAELHRDHGIFLVPTRMDTQGVSRDEAMASGLVPVTTAVAAVPEFVDEHCGVMVDGEDWQGLADGVWALSHDPNRFLELSRQAAERVRRQSGEQVVIPQEISLALGY